MALSQFAISQGRKSLSNAFDGLRKATFISRRTDRLAENRIKACKVHTFSHWYSWTKKIKDAEAIKAAQMSRIKRSTLNQWLVYLHEIQEDRHKCLHAESWQENCSMKKAFEGWKSGAKFEKVNVLRLEHEFRKVLLSQSLTLAFNAWSTFTQFERDTRHEEDAIDAAGIAVFETSYKSKVIRALLDNKSQRIRSNIAANALMEAWDKAATQGAFSVWKSAVKASAAEIDLLIPQVRHSCLHISELEDQLNANTRYADDLFEARTDHFKRSVFSEWRIGVHIQHHQSVQSQMTLLKSRLDRMILKNYISKWFVFVREAQVGKLCKQIEFKDGKMKQLDQSTLALEQTISALRVEHASVQKEYISVSKSHCLEIQRLSEERDALLEEINRSTTISRKRDSSLQQLSEDYKMAQDEYTCRIHSLENRVKNLESELKRAELRLRSADSVKDSAIQRAQEAESKFLQTVRVAQSAQEDAANLKTSLEKSKSDAWALAEQNRKQIEEIVMRRVSEFGMQGKRSSSVASH